MRQTTPGPQTGSGQSEITHHAPPVSHAEPHFAWQLARTMAHLHMDGRYTGISLPVRPNKLTSDFQTLVLTRLGLPPIDTRRSPEKSPDRFAGDEQAAGMSKETQS